MKNERPILFNSEMVNAILENRKTMTRRTRGLCFFNNNPDEWEFTHRGGSTWSGKNVNEKDWEIEFKCPYGEIGHILWVRETVGRTYTVNLNDQEEFIYRADAGSEQFKPLIGRSGNWTPSIHMPKQACRIRLEITGISIERLQSISEEDAKAEGVKIGTDVLLGQTWFCYIANVFVFETAKTSFLTLWQSINGWISVKSNPWVWVIQVKRVAADKHVQS